MLAARTTNRVIRTIAKGALVASAGAAIALGGATAANASPGVVDTQSGGTVDRDGTVGSWVTAVEGEWRDGMDGDPRTLANEWTDPHTVVSDACYGRPHKGCLIGDRGNTHTIKAVSGMSDDPNATLDSDGFQTN